MAHADATTSRESLGAAPTRRLPEWREVAGIVALVAIYLALTAYQVRWHPREDYDELIFMDVGRHLLAFGVPIRTYDVVPQLFFDHTPLYVYLVAAVMAIGGDTLALVRSVTVGFGIATILGVYLGGRLVRGRGSAFVGGLIVATNPFFAFYSWFVRMEVPLACCLVLATLALIRGRALLAGLAIAAAVLFKEIALAYWLVATGYAIVRRRVRDAIAIAVPSVVGLVAWFAYAAQVDGSRLEDTIRRWWLSAAGGDTDPRLRVHRIAWAGIIADRIIGPTGLLAAGAAAPLAALERSGIPAITAVPFGYVVVAVASSFVIRLKEPRYLLAVIPMLALSIALAIDWGDVWRRIRR